MQNFELSVEKSRIPRFQVFKNRNVKYYKILYTFHNKTPFLGLLNFKLCRRGDLHTTFTVPRTFVARHFYFPEMTRSNEYLIRSNNKKHFTQ